MQDNIAFSDLDYCNGYEGSVRCGVSKTIMYRIGTVQYWRRNLGNYSDTGAVTCIVHFVSLKLFFLLTISFDSGRTTC